MPIIPVPIVDEALAHAKKTYKMDLNRTVLIDLYLQIRRRRKQLATLNKQHPELKIASGFRAAREWVLDQRFPQCAPDDRFRRQAYASALGKIGHSLRKEEQRSFRLKRTEREKLIEQVTLDSDRRQYRLFL